jgi:hypothetical protein
VTEAIPRYCPLDVPPALCARDCGMGPCALRACQDEAFARAAATADLRRVPYDDGPIELIRRVVEEVATPGRLAAVAETMTPDDLAAFEGSLLRSLGLRPRCGRDVGGRPCLCALGHPLGCQPDPALVCDRCGVAADHAGQAHAFEPTVVTP